MIESTLQNEMENFDLTSKIEGYYVEENTKAIRIRLEGGISTWVPKRFIDSKFFTIPSLKQEFIIDNWILRKIGFRFNKFQN